MSGLIYLKKTEAYKMFSSIHNYREELGIETKIYKLHDGSMLNYYGHMRGVDIQIEDIIFYFSDLDSVTTNISNVIYFQEGY